MFHSQWSILPLFQQHQLKTIILYVLTGLFRTDAENLVLSQRGLTWKLARSCCDWLSCSASTMTSDSLWMMTSKGPTSGCVRSIWERKNTFTILCSGCVQLEYLILSYCLSLSNVWECMWKTFCIIMYTRQSQTILNAVQRLIEATFPLCNYLLVYCNLTFHDIHSSKMWGKVKSLLVCIDIHMQLNVWAVTIRQPLFTVLLKADYRRGLQVAVTWITKVVDICWCHTWVSVGGQCFPNYCHYVILQL